LVPTPPRKTEAFRALGFLPFWLTQNSFDWFPAAGFNPNFL
jgi:hypothetical protein